MILVFSKQKGITLVFRNDPLQSLKVSSTFDSIPFVRDYLQKSIEGQLRILFMDELPAIIHRLSLRLWVPEYRTAEMEQNKVDNTSGEGPGHDPLASPPQDPVDAFGNPLNPSEIASLSLDSGVETHSLFSQKNLLRLAALTDSQRTLSLFTPSIREVVYRAWTSPSDQGDGTGSVASPLSPALSRTHSNLGSIYSFPDSASAVSMQSRPSFSSHSGHGFSGYGLSLGSGRHSKAHARKRKKRVVDLRRPKTTDDAESLSGESAFTESTGAPSVCSAPVYSAPPPISEEANDDPVTPPLSPQDSMGLPPIPERRRTSSYRPVHPRPFPAQFTEEASSSIPSRSVPDSGHLAKIDDLEVTPRAPVRAEPRSSQVSEKHESGPSTDPTRPLPASILSFKDTAAPHGDVIDQAWVTKMAGEIARRMHEEKMTSNQCDSFWNRRNFDEAPPAYGQ